MVAGQVKRGISQTQAFRFFGIFMSLIFMMSCDRPSLENSKVRIQVPQSPNQGQSTQDCYAVLVTGDGIPDERATCVAARGIFQGFVSGGGSLELSVPKGLKRVFTVYFSSGLACRPFSEATRDLSFSFHKVGESQPMDINKPEETVSINVVAPTANNLVTQPASCLTSNSNNSGVQIENAKVSVGFTSSSATENGVTLTLEARVNSLGVARE